MCMSAPDFKVAGQSGWIRCYPGEIIQQMIVVYIFGKDWSSYLPRSVSSRRRVEMCDGFRKVTMVAQMNLGGSRKLKLSLEVGVQVLHPIMRILHKSACHDRQPAYAGGE